MSEISAGRSKTGHTARPGAEDPRPSGTPYDDVFKTMLVHCSHLLLFLLNELFGEHYTGDEEVVPCNSEHFATGTKGRQRKRITDGHFIVRSSRGEQTYLIECQTEPDGTILIRIFEYAVQSALERATMEGDTLRVDFPRAALIALRSRKDAPRKRKIEVSFPSGEAVSYEVPVLNVKDLTSDDIFKKDLLSLLPFWLFAHEARFDAIEGDEAELEALLDEQARVLERLGERVRGEALTERDGLLILEMMRKVADAIAAKHGKVREELKKVMGGTAFLPETVKLYDKGWEKGMIRGRREGKREGKREGIALGRKEGILATARRMKL
ncbi:MAG: hypothetical protein IJR14_09240, partial [Synergistaceae bacterium]|nr:hypothetical protein [Synergistaceae bacterium]